MVFRDGVSLRSTFDQIGYLGFTDLDHFLREVCVKNDDGQILRYRLIVDLN